MATMATLRKKAKEMGVTVDDSRNGYHADIELLAPKGKMFNATLCHCVVLPSYAGPAEWRREQIEDALADLALGLDDCDEPDCDVCAEG